MKIAAGTASGISYRAANRGLRRSDWGRQVRGPVPTVTVRERMSLLDDAPRWTFLSLAGR